MKFKRRTEVKKRITHRKAPAAGTLLKCFEMTV
jgi:hypothetical protein